MAIQKLNGRAGFSINHPPVDLIDNTGNYTTTTGNISAVDGTFTGDVSAAHFNGDFLGELQVDCKNTSGSIIAAGTPVYITGTVGATNVLEVSPADAGDSSKMPAVGLTSEQLAVNGTGHITIMGVVQNMNTNSYAVGQTLYVAVGGGLTGTKPTGATQLIQNIGKVGRVNANNGEIIVTGPGRTNDVPNTISITGGLTVGGDLTVNGTTTNINTTNLVVEDKNIIIGDTTTPTDITADGGGITLKGTTDKTFNWVDSTDAWTSSEHLGLLSGKSFYINGSLVLSANTLGTGVTNSSLSTLGTISSGIWNGSTIGTIYGGTGLTSYTTGDLLYSSATNTLSKLAIGSNATVLTSSGTAPQWTASTGTGNIVRATSPTLVTPDIGSATATSITGTTLNINDNTTSTTVIGAFTSSTTNISVDNSLGFINISEFGGGGINIDSSSTVNIGDISGQGGTGEYVIIDPSSYNISTGSMGITTSSLNSPAINCSTNNTIISTSGVATLTTTATTQVTLLALSRGSYRSAKFLIQAVNTTGGKYQITEINAIHNGGTTVASATINDSNTGGSNATYAVDAVASAGGQFRLRVTPSSTQSTTFKVFYTAILL
jgi:hypothetical protein